MRPESTARATSLSLFAGLFVACVAVLPVAQAASIATAGERSAIELRPCADGPRLGAEHAGADDRRLPVPAVVPGAEPGAVERWASLVDADAAPTTATCPRSAPLWALAPKTSPPRDHA